MAPQLTLFSKIVRASSLAVEDAKFSPWSELEIAALIIVLLECRGEFLENERRDIAWPVLTALRRFNPADR
jgi:hypothetical protein